MSAANVIFNQIKAMDSMALFDWGALRYRPTASADGLTLTLKSSGMVPWKGYIAITYNQGSDLYDVEFYRMRKHRNPKDPFAAPVKKVDRKVTDVFVDSLVSVIDRQVLKRG